MFFFFRLLLYFSWIHLFFFKLCSFSSNSCYISRKYAFFFFKLCSFSSNSCYISRKYTSFSSNYVLFLQILVVKFQVKQSTLIFRTPAVLGTPTHIWKLFFVLFVSDYPIHHCIKIWTQSENFSFFETPCCFRCQLS